MSKAITSSQNSSNAMLAEVLSESQWISRYFVNHSVFKSTDKSCGWSDDYTEIFIYLNQISMMPMISIFNVEMINELLFVSAFPNNEADFIKLMDLAGWRQQIN